MGDDNGHATGIIALLSLTVFCLLFIILMVDYHGVYTIKETLDIEFKNIVMNESGLNLTDEYTSDYIAKFEDEDEEQFTENIKGKFISHMSSKGYDVTVNNLDVKYPSERTITFSFDGSFKFSPMISKGLLIFDMPAKSRTRVIRVDDYEAETEADSTIDAAGLEDVPVEGIGIDEDINPEEEKEEVDNLEDIPVDNLPETTP